MCEFVVISSLCVIAFALLCIFDPSQIRKKQREETERQFQEDLKSRWRDAGGDGDND